MELVLITWLIYSCISRILSLQHVIILKIIIYFTFFPNKIFTIQCIFYTYSSSQFRPVTLEMLNSHMWIVDAMLEKTDLDIQKVGHGWVWNNQKRLLEGGESSFLSLLLLSTSRKNEQFNFRELVWGMIVVKQRSLSFTAKDSIWDVIPT